jgi:SH3-domain binding protein 5
LGSCIEKARPYHEACEKARLAQIECQKAAVQYQRANEIHAAAKETVALAEERFMSNSHEWQFDGAWQEMLNHATLKVSYSPFNCQMYMGNDH